MRKHAAASVVAVLVASTTSNAAFFGVELVESGVDDLLGNGLFDVYHVSVENCSGDATSAAFTFPGQFLTGVGTTFKDSTDLTAGTIGDSFIVLPPGTTPLAALQVDTPTLLDVAYTVSGTTPVVPLGTVTVAVLSVPAGQFPNLFDFSGILVVDGVEVPVLGDRICPEPTSALLVAICLVGVATSRRG